MWIWCDKNRTINYHSVLTTQHMVRGQMSSTDTCKSQVCDSNRSLFFHWVSRDALAENHSRLRNVFCPFLEMAAITDPLVPQVLICAFKDGSEDVCQEFNEWNSTKQHPPACLRLTVAMWQMEYAAKWKCFLVTEAYSSRVRFDMELSSRVPTLRMRRKFQWY